MRHRFHSLCPYFAMFPESFVEKWVPVLSRPGEYILDPFCGRGTTPLQAILMGRRAIASDINPVAYCVTKAKTNAPKLNSVQRRIAFLERNFSSDDWREQSRQLPAFFRIAYHSSTLLQLLYLKSQLKWVASDVDCMVTALVLGSLHGESSGSSSYLSNQMPRTISTKPLYSIGFWQSRNLRPPKRDAFAILRQRLLFRYESQTPKRRGLVLQTDMRELPWIYDVRSKPIRCVITSPPYLNVTSFEEDQWLRIWFLGGAPHPTYNKISRDDRHEKPAAYWKMIADLWRTLGIVLARDSNILIRIGGKNFLPDQLTETLTASAIFSRRKVKLVHREVSEIRNKQTDRFRPGSKGCLFEIDCQYQMT
jgi:DNA methylase